MAKQCTFSVRLQGTLEILSNQFERRYEAFDRVVINKLHEVVLIRQIEVIYFLAVFGERSTRKEVQLSSKL